jgi:branched-chain amino acid aminotransferase
MRAEAIVWRDGALIDADGAVSAQDRGYLIGDCVFETVLVVDGAPAFLLRHLERLRIGAKVLGITRAIEADEIMDGLGALWKATGGPPRAALRATMTRAGGRRGLLPVDATPVLTLSLNSVTAPPADMTIVPVSVRRFSGAPTNAFKCSGAYAANMIGRQEAARLGADEALMFNERNNLASASAANVFLVESGRLLTPALSEGAMPGVVRSVIGEEAQRLGVPYEEISVSAHALDGACLFLTNSLIGIAPATMIGAAPRAPDPLFAALKAAYDARLADDIAHSLDTRSP